MWSDCDTRLIYFRVRKNISTRIALFSTIKNVVVFFLKKIVISRPFKFVIELSQTLKVYKKWIVHMFKISENP